MRNTLITLAAWTIAIAVVSWQRLVRPAIERAFPGILEPAPESIAASCESNPCLTRAARPARLEHTSAPAEQAETHAPAAPRKSRTRTSKRAGFAAA
jgi:hypothetical protein